MDQIISGLTNLGVNGLFLAALIAFAWFRETKTLPRMLEVFEVQAQKNREHSAQEARFEREACERHHRELLAAVKEYRDETVGGIKETRHAVKQLTAEASLLNKLVWQSMEEKGVQPKGGEE